MSEKTLRVVGIAGFTESKGQIAPVLEHAREQLNLEDIEPFSLYDAFNKPSNLLKAAERAVLITHSSGALASHYAFNADAFISFAGSEPTSRGDLIRHAKDKTAAHFGRLKGSENRADAMKILSAGGFELIKHPVFNTNAIGMISVSSSIEKATSFKRNNPNASTRYIQHLDDEFRFDPSDYAYEKASAIGVEVIAAPGTHDEIYLNYNALDYAKLEDLQID